MNDKLRKKEVGAGGGEDFSPSERGLPQDRSIVHFKRDHLKDCPDGPEEKDSRGCGLGGRGRRQSGASTTKSNR